MKPNIGHTFTCTDAKGAQQEQRTQKIKVEVTLKEEKRREQQVNFLKETMNMSEEDIEKMVDN